MTEVNNIRIFPIIGSSIIKMFQKKFSISSYYYNYFTFVYRICLYAKIHLLYILIWLK